MGLYKAGLEHRANKISKLIPLFPFGCAVTVAFCNAVITKLLTMQPDTLLYIQKYFEAFREIIFK